MLPPLPLQEWEPTKKTLHRYLQIIGKIKIALHPPMNNWWHIVLHTHPRGFTTRSIPYNFISFEIALDCIDHRLIVSCSHGHTESFALVDGLSVSDFYKQLFNCLEKVGISASIKKIPYDLEDEIPFPEDHTHHHYDQEYVHRFWQVMRWTDQVFQEFAGKAYCKTSPVNIYWHHLDIAVARFNGERGPDMPDAGKADQEAYSHELISFGFWAGDEQMREPAFYSYTYPSPDGIDSQPLNPSSAEWIDSNGSPMALLKYHDLLDHKEFKSTLLAFMQSAYDAGAKLANWDVEECK
jgi:hypothetical protein